MNDEERLQDALANKVAEVLKEHGIKPVDIGVTLSRHTNYLRGKTFRAQPTVILRYSFGMQDGYAAMILRAMPLDASGYAKTYSAAGKKAVDTMKKNLSSFINGLSDTHRAILLRAIG